MNLTTKPFSQPTLLLLILFSLTILLAGILLRATSKQLDDDEIQNYENNTDYFMTNETVLQSRKTRRKEYLYRLLTNTTRSLIQMEIKARRLEENMRRIKEKTADLLWKNKDKALWHILFKNISRHISIRHEFHQHASLRRIMQDVHSHKHKVGRRKDLFRR